MIVDEEGTFSGVIQMSSITKLGFALHGVPLGADPLLVGTSMSPAEQCIACPYLHLNCKCSLGKASNQSANPRCVGPMGYYDAWHTATSGSTAREQCEADGDIWCGEAKHNLTVLLLKDPAWSHCTLSAAWRDIITTTRFVTGGLGKLMDEAVYEVWVCDLADPCIAVAGQQQKHAAEAEASGMCYAYNEQTRVFEPLTLLSRARFTRRAP